MEREMNLIYGRKSPGRNPLYCKDKKFICKKNNIFSKGYNYKKLINRAKPF